MSFDLDAFRAKYSRFLRTDRILLTGHSHQAWPDIARDAMIEAFDDAARLVDDKWGAAVFPKMEVVGKNVLTRLGFDEGDAIAFGKSTHELVTRLLSCFPLSGRPVVVTTRAEFHSLHRQLCRLTEEGLRVVWVESADREGLVDRFLAAIQPGVSLVALSAVLFEDAYVVPRIGEILAAAVDVGAVVLVDAYHAFNVVPIDWGPAKDAIFVTGGGYKYAQLGEGVCFLRVPASTTLRPVDTGWFADFSALEGERSNAVGYGPGGARFSGATFDPTPFYRAAAVLQHFDAFGLDVPTLRQVSVRQTRRVIDVLVDEGLGENVASPRDDSRRGGFVAVRSPSSHGVVGRLRQRGVFVDSRYDLVRIGPAPYLTDDEIERGTRAVAEEIRRAMETE